MHKEKNVLITTFLLIFVHFPLANQACSQTLGLVVSWLGLLQLPSNCCLRILINKENEYKGIYYAV